MTGLLAIKLRRDLRASWPRFALMVVAIAVSLAAAGGVLFAWSASGRETGGAYLRTEPASATIVLDRPVDADRMAALVGEVRRRPGVVEVTGRTQFDSQVEVNGRPRAVPIQVFGAAPDDPMRMVKVLPSQRRWPPAADEILLGQDSLGVLGAAVGDTVTITPPGGGPVQLRVADTVYDPSLSPSPQEQRGRGYVSAAALPGRGGLAPLDQLKLQIADPGQTIPSRDRDMIVAVAGGIGEWLRGEQGLAVREIQVPQPYAHPHQWQTDVLLGSLLAGGAAALLLSTILVAAMLNNLFTQQIPQLGIMKAIGARSARIGRLYLAMTLLVALAATLVALPLAVLLGRDLAGRSLAILGIQPASLAPARWTYAAVAAVGLGLPLLLALIPLVKASRTTVRAAIDHRGLGARPNAATSVLTRALARLGRLRRLDRGLLLALRNTIRRPARFWLSAGLLACAGTVFVAGMSLSAGTQAIAEEQQARRTWDVTVQLAGGAPLTEVTALAKRVPGVRAVDALTVAPAGVAGPGRIPITRTYPDQGHGRTTVAAIPPGATTVRPPKLLEGRWLNPAETGAVVLNRNTRDKAVPGVGAGGTIDLVVDGRSTTWRVVGLAEEREGTGDVYTTAEGLAAAMGRPQRANQLRLTADRHDEPTRQAIATAVNAALTNAGVEVTSAASISRSEAITAGHLGPVLLVLLGVALPLGVVGVIGLGATMSANILDRIREFGVMHAIGARPRAVRRIVAAEGVFLALASCLLAVIPALALTKVLGIGLGNLFGSAPLPYRISIPAAAIWVALAVLGAVLATDAAAARASRLTVREALAYL